ncbi:MAG: hypothetical protein LC791_16165 [Acidobacteria bacterium]|nr:hypothetical protein [Acidobacteriota bacterium]
MRRSTICWRQGFSVAAIWTLIKGERIARATIRTVEGRREARFYVDGELIHSQLFPDGDEDGARRMAGQKRQEFVKRGWS